MSIAYPKKKKNLWRTYCGRSAQEDVLLAYKGVTTLLLPCKGEKHELKQHQKLQGTFHNRMSIGASSQN